MQGSKYNDSRFTIKRYTKKKKEVKQLPLFLPYIYEIQYQSQYQSHICPILLILRLLPPRPPPNFNALIPVQSAITRAAIKVTKRSIIRARRQPTLAPQLIDNTTEQFAWSGQGTIHAKLPFDHETTRYDTCSARSERLIGPKRIAPFPRMCRSKFQFAPTIICLRADDKYFERDGTLETHYESPPTPFPPCPGSIRAPTYSFGSDGAPLKGYITRWFC